MLQKLTRGAPAQGPRPAVPLSVIGPDVRIVGNIITQGEMQIDGQVEGDITCQTLVVGEGARIAGAVVAESVRVHGHLSGKIDANTVMIARSAEVVGDITHESLEIEAGGHLEGHLIRKVSQRAKALLPAEDKKVIEAPAPAPAKAAAEA
jgi:Integral membrane protein CcmA involved in cell shape determination